MSLGGRLLRAYSRSMSAPAPIGGPCPSPPSALPAPRVRIMAHTGSLWWPVTPRWWACRLQQCRLRGALPVPGRLPGPPACAGRALPVRAVPQPRLPGAAAGGVAEGRRSWPGVGRPAAGQAWITIRPGARRGKSPLLGLDRISAGPSPITTSPAGPAVGAAQPGRGAHCAAEAGGTLPRPSAHGGGWRHRVAGHQAGRAAAGGGAHPGGGGAGLQVGGWVGGPFSWGGGGGVRGIKTAGRAANRSRLPNPGWHG